MERVQYRAFTIPEVPEVTRKPENLLEQKEVSRIFGPSIQALRNLTQAHNISLPNALEERLFFVDDKTYQNLTTPQDASIPDRVETIEGGIVLPKHRLCLINDPIISKVSDDQKTNKENLRRATGIHELIHSVSYMEVWLSPSDSDFPENKSFDEIGRRGGIITQKPGKVTREGMGLHFLNEGFVDYLTRETLQSQGYSLEKTLYTLPLEVIDLLAKDVDIDHFFQATFTKSGFRKLVMAIEVAYGRGAFKDIIRLLSEDMDAWATAEMYGLIELPPQAQAYIRDKSLRKVKAS